MKFFKQITEEKLMFNLDNRLCVNKYYPRDEISSQLFRYEFTVTYNPKRVWSIQYAESLTSYVIGDLEKFISRVSKSEVDQFGYNYVVEYQKNGYPHIHGTIFSEVNIKPEQQSNFEKLLIRKYGRSDVYATGHIDKMHKNDHFIGTWQEYIKKECTPRYFFSFNE